MEDRRDVDPFAHLDDLPRMRGPTHLAFVEGGFHTWLNHAGALPEADVGVEAIGAFPRSASGDRWRWTVPGQ